MEPLKAMPNFGAAKTIYVPTPKTKKHNRASIFEEAYRKNKPEGIFNHNVCSFSVIGKLHKNIMEPSTHGNAISLYVDNSTFGANERGWVIGNMGFQFHNEIRYPLEDGNKVIGTRGWLLWESVANVFESNTYSLFTHDSIIYASMTIETGVTYVIQQRPEMYWVRGGFFYLLNGYYLSNFKNPKK
jgi:hypothetical protein